MTKLFAFYATATASIPSITETISKDSNFLAVLKGRGQCFSVFWVTRIRITCYCSRDVKIQVPRPHLQLINLEFLHVWPGIFDKHPEWFECTKGLKSTHQTVALKPCTNLIITGNPLPTKMQVGVHFVHSLKEFTGVLKPTSGPFPRFAWTPELEPLLWWPSFEASRKILRTPMCSPPFCWGEPLTIRIFHLNLKMKYVFSHPVHTSIMMLKLL